MATRAVPAPLAQPPNALTVVRLALIPVFVAVAIQAGGDASWAAGALFGAAGITDQIDGWLARRWRVESNFGRFVDPLADSVIIDAAVIVLWAYDRLPWPALVLVLAFLMLLEAPDIITAFLALLSPEHAELLGVEEGRAVLAAPLALPAAEEHDPGYDEGEL